jgi:hypothetical protein
MIQSMPLTLGGSSHTWVILDALRRQRNANDHTGHSITQAVVAECMGQATALRTRLHAHLAAGHPDLLTKPA